MVERGVGRGGHLEHERLVEHGVQGALLHVRLLLGDALSVVEKVHLYVAVENMVIFCVCQHITLVKTSEVLRHIVYIVSENQVTFMEWNSVNRTFGRTRTCICSFIFWEIMPLYYRW